MERRNLALSCVLFAVLAHACRTPDTIIEPASKADVRTALVEVCRSQQDAWNAGDIDGFLARGYWNDDRVTFLSGGTWTRGYEPVMARFKKRYAEEGNEMGRLTFTDLETLVLDPQAGMVRGRWHLVYSDGSNDGGLFTLLMRQFEEGWRIVHDHTSSDSGG